MRKVFHGLVKAACSPWVGWIGFWGAGGVLVGLGGLVLHISAAPSYLSNAPETCINCHVMTDAYLSWQHSSHAQVAVCNDCHVPQDHFFHQWGFKALDGLRHATVFTFRWEPQVLRLSERAKSVVQANCQRCHQRVLDHLDEVVARGGSGSGERPVLGQERFCWDCHRHTPHERVHSLSGSPDVFRPRLPSPIWWKQKPRIPQEPR